MGVGGNIGYQLEFLMEMDIKYELESVGISNISCDIEYQLRY